MSSISVIIPTLNRPALLAEAVGSAVHQTRRPDEIIIVDDGSVSPIDAVHLTEQFGTRIRVIRNEASQGLAWARNQGVEAASGNYIIHLDDDDLYAPEILEECASLLDEYPDLELVFIGVEGFGNSAEHFNRVHPMGVAKVIEQGLGKVLRDGVYLFDGHLIDGLLNQVPMPFQRVMARRHVWHKVSQLRCKSYQGAFGLSSLDQARDLVRGTLRDSEWALYAGLTCKKTALINKPLYLQRCEGQGRSSQPAMKQKHIHQAVIIKTVLNKLAQRDLESHSSHTLIHDSLEKTHFDAAYEFINMEIYGKALNHLWHAFSLGPRLKHLKLLARLGLTYTANKFKGH